MTSENPPSCPCCGADLEPLGTAGRSGDFFCGVCQIAVSREALDAGGEMLLPCPVHEEVPDAERDPIAERPSIVGAGDEGDVTQFFDEGGPSRPFQVVMSFVQGVLSGEDVRLGNLVMAPYEQWDLDVLRDMLEGHGVASRTRYPTPGWAEIRLVETAEPVVVTGPTVVMGYSVYVKFIEELNDWRIYRIGSQVDPSTLPD